ncbi:hypothetical protein HK405_008679 [Cladochytrium tenue]|nr:hypothetical protein HK405_008679 [Cladochytrium tenue]
MLQQQAPSVQVIDSGVSRSQSAPAMPPLSRGEALRATPRLQQQSVSPNRRRPSGTPASTRRPAPTPSAEPAVARPGTPTRAVGGTRQGVRAPVLPQPSTSPPPTVVVAFGRTVRAAAPRTSARPHPAASRGMVPRAGGAQPAAATPAASRPLTVFPPGTLVASAAPKLESETNGVQLEAAQEDELPACVVCLDPEPQLRTTCCRQPYHVSCAYKWLLVNKSCPTCRFAMPLRGEYPAVPKPPPRPRPLPPPPPPAAPPPPRPSVSDAATDTDGLDEAPVPHALEVPTTPPVGTQGANLSPVGGLAGVVDWESARVEQLQEEDVEEVEDEFFDAVPE